MSVEENVAVWLWVTEQIEREMRLLSKSDLLRWNASADQQWWQCKFPHNFQATHHHCSINHGSTIHTV